ncbi:MAG: adenosylcobinamide kinase / adenosylcobinamide-phosphate guanylyltransferase [Actinomycetota bacterium]|nr:adenosylcobinamide kinase / adenosylcobinamide-phosphate guanylyltransferase [Actinomycetota bacterium]
MITLVLGGARSGKSEVGERLAARLGAAVTYVATALVDPADGDWVRRVDEHRGRRPPSWTTVEAGADLPTVLAAVDGPVLVDSLGTWLAACGALAGGPAADSGADAGALCQALAHRTGDTIVVSEEVGLGVHPSSEAGRRFRDQLGLVNQAVADVADEVVLVVAGRVLPLARL